ncbi:MAG: hypothetical protein HOP34_15455 [Methylococcaceae bacterium]|nr:hypothetical protein [Methylococcaceae bacterium]
MENEVVATSKGTLAAIGTAAKTLVLAHPVSVAVVGGALIGWGTYYAVGKYIAKKAAADESATATA